MRRGRRSVEALSGARREARGGGRFHDSRRRGRGFEALCGAGEALRGVRRRAARQEVARRGLGRRRHRGFGRVRRGGIHARRGARADSDNSPFDGRFFRRRQDGHKHKRGQKPTSTPRFSRPCRRASFPRGSRRSSSAARSATPNSSKTSSGRAGISDAARSTCRRPSADPAR